MSNVNFAELPVIAIACGLVRTILPQAVSIPLLARIAVAAHVLFFVLTVSFPTI
jgi:hypothetical protein